LQFDHGKFWNEGAEKNPQLEIQLSVNALGNVPEEQRQGNDGDQNQS
jgi:hypothetical protein